MIQNVNPKQENKMEHNTAFTRYENVIIRETKEFAKQNGIPFSAMTALMITNAIKQVKAEEWQKEKARKEIIRQQDHYIKMLEDELKHRPTSKFNNGWISKTKEEINEIKDRIKNLKDQAKEKKPRQ